MRYSFVTAAALMFANSLSLRRAFAMVLSLDVNQSGLIPKDDGNVEPNLESEKTRWILYAMEYKMVVLK
jgi:hypothetical protein